MITTTSAALVPRTVVTGGMPGWQVTLVALSAALPAAVTAVMAYRARARRLPAVPDDPAGRRRPEITILTWSR